MPQYKEKPKKVWQNAKRSVDCVCCRSCYSIQTVGSQSEADCDSSCPIRWQNIWGKSILIDFTSMGDSCPIRWQNIM